MSGNLPTPQQPPTDRPSRALGAGAMAAIVVGAFLATLVMFGLCAGVFFVGGPRAREALEQANIAVPTARPNWTDWMTQRVLSEVYTGTVDAVVEDQGVVEALGEPVETDVNAAELYVRVNAGDLDSQGEAIEFDVLGPKGRGTVRVTAKGVSNTGMNGPIQIQEITVTLEDGTTIDVEPPPERNVQVR